MRLNPKPNVSGRITRTYFGKKDFSVFREKKVTFLIVIFDWFFVVLDATLITNHIRIWSYKIKTSSDMMTSSSAPERWWVIWVMPMSHTLNIVYNFFFLLVFVFNIFSVLILLLLWLRLLNNNISSRLIISVDNFISSVIIVTKQFSIQIFVFWLHTWFTKVFQGFILRMTHTGYDSR